MPCPGTGSAQARPDLLDHGLDAALLHLDPVVGEGVTAAPRVEECDQLWIGSEKGPAGGSTPPLPDGFDGDVEPNARAMAADKALVGRGEEQSAARRYHHAAPRRERCQGLPLALAKVAL